MRKEILSECSLPYCRAQLSIFLVNLFLSEQCKINIWKEREFNILNYGPSEHLLKNLLSLSSTASYPRIKSRWCIFSFHRPPHFHLLSVHLQNSHCRNIHRHYWTLFHLHSSPRFKMQGADWSMTALVATPHSTTTVRFRYIVPPWNFSLLNKWLKRHCTWLARDQWWHLPPIAKTNGVAKSQHRFHVFW